MKRALIAAGLIAVGALLIGKSSQAGGTGWKDMFTITVPVMRTDVKQGGAALVRVELEREGGFKQSVRLEVRAPRGLEVDPSSVTLWLDSESGVQLRVTADKDAPLGEGKVVVLGTPEIGQTVEAEFNVNVIAK